MHAAGTAYSWKVETPRGGGMQGTELTELLCPWLVGMYFLCGILWVSFL